MSPVARTGRADPCRFGKWSDFRSQVAGVIGDRHVHGLVEARTERRVNSRRRKVVRVIGHETGIEDGDVNAVARLRNIFGIHLVRIVGRVATGCARQAAELVGSHRRKKSCRQSEPHPGRRELTRALFHVSRFSLDQISSEPIPGPVGSLSTRVKRKD
jgi:hypothetical protein